VIRYQSGIKYQIYEEAEYDLQVSGLIIRHSYDGKFYGVNQLTRTLYVKEGFAWDGATMFPDFDWILEASLWHDVLHLLIAQGVIPTSENNKIDEELARAIRKFGGDESRGRIADTMLKIRSGYVRHATNLVHQQVTQARPVYEMRQGRKRRIK
jgi:hypothetical protein